MKYAMRSVPLLLAVAVLALQGGASRAGDEDLRTQVAVETIGSHPTPEDWFANAAVDDPLPKPSIATLDVYTAWHEDLRRRAMAWGARSPGAAEKAAQWLHRAGVLVRFLGGAADSSVPARTEGVVTIPLDPSKGDARMEGVVDFPQDSRQLLRGVKTRVAIFVDGYRDCCAWKMDDVMNLLVDRGFEYAAHQENLQVYRGQNLIILSPWNSLSAISGNTSQNQSPKVTTGATTNFVRHMFRFFSTLPEGTEVFLFGHSFGADSLLRFVSGYHRTAVRIRLVALVDTVTTGGWRSGPNSWRIGSNVDYFFNRWQTNSPFPHNFKSTGRISCDAGKCDQVEQSRWRKRNGNTVYARCGHLENCPGKKVIWQGLKTRIYPGKKQKRLLHGRMPYDAYVQAQLVKILKKFLPAK